MNASGGLVRDNGWSSRRRRVIAVVIQMKVFLLTGPVISCLISTGCDMRHADPGMVQSDTYGQHFTMPLPETVRLIHYQREGTVDGSYFFVFDGATDQFARQVVGEWGLKPIADGERPISFAGLSPPEWWPKDLERLPVRYTWIDRGAERYRSAWFDPDAKRLYAEYGRW